MASNDEPPLAVKIILIVLALGAFALEIRNIYAMGQIERDHEQQINRMLERFNGK